MFHISSRDGIAIQWQTTFRDVLHGTGLQQRWRTTVLSHRLWKYGEGLRKLILAGLSQWTNHISQQAEEMGDVQGVYGWRKKNRSEKCETCRRMIGHDIQQWVTNPAEGIRGNWRCLQAGGHLALASPAHDWHATTFITTAMCLQPHKQYCTAMLAAWMGCLMLAADPLRPDLWSISVIWKPFDGSTM